MERTNNGSGKRLFYALILIGRIEGCTPPEITLLTSLQNDSHSHGFRKQLKTV